LQVEFIRRGRSTHRLEADGSSVVYLLEASFGEVNSHGIAALEQCCSGKIMKKIAMGVNSDNTYCSAVV
jgi:hypothetical protein